MLCAMRVKRFRMRMKRFRMRVKLFLTHQKRCAMHVKRCGAHQQLFRMRLIRCATHQKLFRTHQQWLHTHQKRCATHHLLYCMRQKCCATRHMLGVLRVGRARTHVHRHIRHRPSLPRRTRQWAGCRDHGLMDMTGQHWSTMALQSQDHATRLIYRFRTSGNIPWTEDLGTLRRLTGRSVNRISAGIGPR